jgi:hypothetical protein
VVGPSIAERRPLVFCATCGVTALSRSCITKSALSQPPVGTERDRLRGVGVGLDQRQRRSPLGTTRSGCGHRDDDQTIAVLYQRMPNEAQPRLRLVAALLAFDRFTKECLAAAKSRLARSRKLTVLSARSTAQIQIASLASDLDVCLVDPP